MEKELSQSEIDELFRTAREPAKDARLGPTIACHSAWPYFHEGKSPQSNFETAQAIANYAEQVRAERCAITSCGDHLWIRFGCASDFHVDFLFRSPAAR